MAKTLEQMTKDELLKKLATLPKDRLYHLVKAHVEGRSMYDQPE